jgi:hypothetical protein
VVVGVFVGLQVQNWATDQGQRKLEKNYIERLHSDVVDIQKTREPLLAARDRWGKALTSVSSLLYEDVNREITPSECLGIALSYIVTNPTDTITSLEELQESGQLYLIQNQRVLQSLQNFLLTRARARDAGFGIQSNAVRLSSKHPHLIKVVKPMRYNISTDTVLTREHGTYECDLAAMRTDHSYLNDFELTQSSFGHHVHINILINNSLIDMHNVLDDVLGITHK